MYGYIELEVLSFVSLFDITVLKTESLCLYYISNVIQERAFI